MDRKEWDILSISKKHDYLFNLMKNKEKLLGLDNNKKNNKYTQWINNKKLELKKNGFKQEDIYHLIKDIIYKKCSNCKKYYEYNEINFYKNISQPSGLRYNCKKCFNKVRNKKWKYTKYDSSDKYRNYKRRAKRKDMIFDITEQECVELFNQSCYYCGYTSKSLNGIDRVDVTKGYTKDNVVSCCKYCNQMKGGVENWFCDNRSNGEITFLQHIERIYLYQKSKNK